MKTFEKQYLLELSLQPKIEKQKDKIRRLANEHRQLKSLAIDAKQKIISEGTNIENLLKYKTLIEQIESKQQNIINEIKILKKIGGIFKRKPPVANVTNRKVTTTPSGYPSEHLENVLRSRVNNAGYLHPEYKQFVNDNMHHYLKHVENSIDPELVVARIASERGEGIWRKHFRKQDVLPKHIRSTLHNLGDSK